MYKRGRCRERVGQRIQSGLHFVVEGKRRRWHLAIIVIEDKMDRCGLVTVKSESQINDLTTEMVHDVSEPKWRFLVVLKMLHHPLYHSIWKEMFKRHANSTRGSMILMPNNLNSLKKKSKNYRKCDREAGRP